jgi:hypothetical protein
LSFCRLAPALVSSGHQARLEFFFFRTGSGAGCVDIRSQLANGGGAQLELEGFDVCGDFCDGVDGKFSVWLVSPKSRARIY